MMNIKKIILCFVLLLLASRLYSQTHLEGFVYSTIDSLALQGASVYFDGTSTGVSTTAEGYFKISLEDDTTSPLIISSLGYESFIINLPSQQSSRPLKIYLKESEESLGEVYLEFDPWSRKKKLDIFKREFLGRSAAAAKCRIKNEKVIKLTYIPSKDILVASAAEPIKIVNRYLGYEVNYDLKDFKVEFSTGTSNLRLVHIVYFEGTSFFMDIRKVTPRRFLKNREKAYTGSTLQFMRSLANGNLEENNFRIFKKSYEVPPYSPFRIETKKGLTKVELVEETINILHREIDQSSLKTSGSFYIDNLGNHTPAQNVLFSGVMGNQRMAETLPLNYKETGN
ncbi:carboxypeptidase-like regulatory domain-containing protein [Antarcticibacterium flavum]|uniref:Carboxypeptidase-like regulatory domain-containing protein n=1 Tax=Antarcticibacterium flavum TaxID=2058175 RepID=A0A5B7X2D8_9FLAO|nr:MULTISPECIES: carboxypeptidase-like regulatory domain-containing protein [Antarcticibacterium]MCM4160714.1 hypothetical protein [Antarcticibacterium sp. W02-3]QCY68808.1 carboxypeptidase-like regulatory domain-containing protein [Antarcticibacterium flavum]